jgi:hypothetical protein
MMMPPIELGLAILGTRFKRLNRSVEKLRFRLFKKDSDARRINEMECWSNGVLEGGSNPSLHHSIAPLLQSR